MAGGRRHGMAVDQDGGAEIAMQLGEQSPQRAVIGLVEALDAGERIVHRDALVVDFLCVADHPRHGAEPARHPHRAGIGEGGQTALEHARIELVGLAIDVDKAAREMRAHHRKAALDHAGDQVVDEAVLGAAQRLDIEPRRAEEVARIGGTTMRRIEHHRSRARRRFDDLEGRVKFVADFTHRLWQSLGFGNHGASAANMYSLTEDYHGGTWPLYGLNALIRTILHAPACNAKPCFRFTRYLPGIRLMGHLGRP